MTGLEIALAIVLLIAISLAGHFWVRIGELGDRIHQQNDAAINQAIRHCEDMTRLTDELADTRAALAGGAEEVERLTLLAGQQHASEQAS